MHRQYFYPTILVRIAVLNKFISVFKITTLGNYFVTSMWCKVQHKQTVTDHSLINDD